MGQLTLLSSAKDLISTQGRAYSSSSSRNSTNISIAKNNSNSNNNSNINPIDKPITLNPQLNNTSPLHMQSPK